MRVKIIRGGVMRSATGGLRRAFERFSAVSSEVTRFDAAGIRWHAANLT